MLEIADIYEVNSVTIIADKGMSVNRNIRFLESKNWKYIILILEWKHLKLNNLIDYVLKNSQFWTLYNFNNLLKNSYFCPLNTLNYLNN